MIRNIILCALASAAMIPVAAAAAPGGHGGGGEGRGSLMGNAGGLGLGGIGDVGMRGGMNANANNDIGVQNREASRINSQALQHASQTGIDHANQNSVLAGTSSTTTVRSGALSGLTTG